ncbi:MAG: Uma2 family endonuclease [Fimbriimonadia bacterium]|nr:Uma2 family endonuclease [Fimbriimonadia bacterium]
MVSGAPQDYKKTHSPTALLVIEVADASLEYDRSVKASLYASGGVPEYWIVNLRERCLEMFREPEPDSDSPFLARYRLVAILRGEASPAPLFKPDLHLTVA